MGELEISPATPHKLSSLWQKTFGLGWMNLNAKLPIQRSEILDYGFSGKPLANVATGRLSQPGSQGVVGENCDDRSSERVGLPVLYQQTIDAVLYHVRNPPYRGGYHRDPARHGFQHADRQRLEVRRQHEDIGLPQQIVFLAAIDPARKSKRLVDAQGSREPHERVGVLAAGNAAAGNHKRGLGHKAQNDGYRPQ